MRRFLFCFTIFLSVQLSVAAIDTAKLIINDTQAVKTALGWKLVSESSLTYKCGDSLIEKRVIHPLGYLTVEKSIPDNLVQLAVKTKVPITVDTVTQCLLSLNKEYIVRRIIYNQKTEAVSWIQPVIIAPDYDKKKKDSIEKIFIITIIAVTAVTIIFIVWLVATMVATIAAKQKKVAKKETPDTLGAKKHNP
jgi:hypothetical protein